MSACPIVISPVFNANIDNFCFLTFFFLSQMFYWSSQRTSFLFHWLFSIAFVFNFINFCSCFYYFLPSSFGLLLILFVVCFLIWKLRLLTWGFSSLLMWAFSAINLTFSTVLLCPTFWHVFSFVSLETSSSIHYLEICCLVSKCWGIFLLYFCYWFLVWFQFHQKAHDFSSFKLVEVCFMIRDMVLVYVSWAFEKMCILLLLNGVFCQYKLDLVGCWYSWVILYPCWFSI